MGSVLRRSMPSCCCRESKPSRRAWNGTSRTRARSRSSVTLEMEMTLETEKNRCYFLALDPRIRIENFAYPYGFASVFRSAPSIFPGVNSSAIDLQFLLHAA